MSLLGNVGLSREHLIREWLLENCTLETWRDTWGNTNNKKANIIIKEGKDGKWYVNTYYTNIYIKNPSAITNGDFEWKTIKNGNFDCSDCIDLKSYKGMPKKVGGSLVLPYNYADIKDIYSLPSFDNCYNIKVIGEITRDYYHLQEDYYPKITPSQNRSSIERRRLLSEGWYGLKRKWI